jgi:hypothetical protein
MSALFTQIIHREVYSFLLIPPWIWNESCLLSSGKRQARLAGVLPIEPMLLAVLIDELVDPIMNVGVFELIAELLARGLHVKHAAEFDKGINERKARLNLYVKGFSLSLT